MSICAMSPEERVPVPDKAAGGTLKKAFFCIAMLLAFCYGLPVYAQRPKNILLYTNWQNSNIGDIGHTPGTLATLEKYIPEANVVCWMRSTSAEVEAMIKKRFPKAAFVYGNIVEYDKPQNAALKMAFDTADLFMWNSGMHLNFGVFGKDWAVPTWSLFALNYAYSRHIPFVLYGHSFDKFEDNSHIAYRSTLDRAAMILCRDKESQNYMQELGFRPKLLDFGPDAVFGIDVKDETRAGSFLQANGLEPRKFLAVVIRTNSPKILDQAGHNDLLNPVAITEAQKEENHRWMQKTREVITWWVREKKMKVLLAPEVNKEIRYAKEWVLDSLPPDVQGNVVWRSSFWNVDEANAVYAQAHSVLGLEPHSLIMALANGVPVVHARAQKYGKKGYMFRDIGLGDWLFDIDQDSSADIIRALDGIATNYPRAKEKVAGAMQFVQQKQQEHMMVIRRLLELPGN